MTDTSDDLFVSAAGMAPAVNYADWTYGLFAPLVRGAVLEVGCGVGTFTRRMLTAPGLNALTSIDVLEAAVRQCRATIQDPRLDLRHADVRDITGAFDAVVCMNVLEHIEDDRAALAHMLGLLRPGGTLFLLVPAHALLYSAFDVGAGHFRRYNKRGMRELFQTAAPGGGLTIDQFYFNSIGALGYWAVYKLLRKAPRGGADAEIGWFDRVIVPWQRRLEPRQVPFGISLVSVATRTAA
jgi:SAM-dependent methyltransferase